jgi:hypothetical protein
MLKETIKLFGQILIFSGFLIFFYTFMTAYNHPTKTVVVDINSFGESGIEYWIVFAQFSIGGLSIYLSCRDFILERILGRANTG